MQQRKELRQAGLKVTLPRLKILEILEDAKLRHMSAEDIYKHLLEEGEDIGLATVYRVLTQFEWMCENSSAVGLRNKLEEVFQWDCTIPQLNAVFELTI